VRLVEDDQIPLGLLQPRKDVLLYRQVHRGDDKVVLEPCILPKGTADRVASKQGKALSEPLPHFPPPLIGQSLGTEDEYAPRLLALHQLPHQQPRHDGFARSWIIGEQEGDARQRQDVLVDRI
jgi:hypothetical protein